MSAIDYEAESAKRLNWLDITGGGAKDSLTVLDYFAGKALAGYVAYMGFDPSEVDEICAVRGAATNAEAVAKSAYLIAEAMLKEREKRSVPAHAVQGITGKHYG